MLTFSLLVPNLEKWSIQYRLYKSQRNESLEVIISTFHLMSATSFYESLNVVRSKRKQNMVMEQSVVSITVIQVLTRK
jgi:hypothetical protein